MSELKQIIDSLKTIEDKQTQQDEKLDTHGIAIIKVLSVLENDEKTNTKGIVEQTRDNKEAIVGLQQDAKIRTTRIKTILAVWTVAMGAVTAYFNFKN